MTKKVLCVDDESLVLEGLENTLGWDFSVVTFTSGAEALDYLRSNSEEVGVIISDMRMPGMDGATFLSEVARSYPDIVRMLLTGYSDIESALRAINHGKIFRMLMKPIGAEELGGAVRDAFRQAELIEAEKVVLEGTLKGAIEALMEALSLASPLAMSRSRILERMVRHIGQTLGDSNWEYETAALLALLGTIASPNSVLEKFAIGAPISPQEAETIEGYAELGYDMLKKIPRLERVAEIVRRHRDPGQSEAEFVKVGAQRLQASLLFDQQVLRGATPQEVSEHLRRAGVSKEIVAALMSFRPPLSADASRFVDLAQLLPDMRLETDVHSKTGQLLLRKDTVLSWASIERLRNFDRGVGVETPLHVSMITRCV
ncbi:response regulator [Microvenator marinus]|uniref:Response regulator n=1 Tax=Microvenator marinus TaxID=2600177 RepID=A0A5B8XSW6_9DELT|nr:response regulator [Microvenator marinus]QED28635.1 response regulator [Microvenator marinus]